jgi:DNA invertase Pin-like site-specific DNA recombinase
MPTPAKSPEVIARIREMLAQKIPHRIIAKECSVSTGFVSKVGLGDYKEPTDKPVNPATLPA